MKDEKKAPKLRFKGFTDDWEQCKLGDVASFTNGRAYKQDELLDKGKYRVLRVGNLYTNGSWYYSNMELDDKYYINKGDLIYTWSATFGPHIWDGERVIYHYHIWKVELSDRLDKKFATQLLEIDKAKLLSNTNGSTMVHITKNGMENKQVILPSITEQSCIGKLLRNLDQTITLHEEKKCQLERLKSALLQKMFADKSGYPPVRFNGFDEMWEYCKLEEVFVERNQKEVADANYPLCSFIAHKGVVPKDKYDRSFLVKSNGKKYKRTEINDFIYSSNNLETGSIGLNKFGRATISPVYSIFMVKGDSDFIAGLASTPQFIYEMIRFRQGVVYGQWRIHESDFLKIKYYIPQVTEQEKIGNLLSKLTHAIILHERKLKLLLRVKQSLLQKMFI